ncbi:MAG: hypothetical protein AABX29_04475 [Nanoarchaeota archaeon]|mgnify:CR=1 FL=1
MNKIKLIGIFCIFLIVSLPIASAQLVNPSNPGERSNFDISGRQLPDGYYRIGNNIYYGNTIVSTDGVYRGTIGYNPGGVVGQPTNTYTGQVNPYVDQNGNILPQYSQVYYKDAYGNIIDKSTNRPVYQAQTYPYSSYPYSGQIPSGQVQFNTGPSFIPSYMDRSGNLLPGYTRDSNTGEIRDQNGRVIATKEEADRIGASLRVGAGEINFNYIGPSDGSGLSLGTTTGNLLLNVNRYEPTVLTANLIEEQSVPVYAFLSGSIATAPGIAPKISYMDVNVIGGDVQYVAGKPRFNPPIAYTLEDLGYVETWLTRIPKESQVPKKIDLTLQARVQFEGDSTVPIFGGEERKILQEDRKRDIFIRGGFADQNLRIFGGRAYLRAKYISDNRVSFDVYTGDGVYIGELSASPGQETYPISIVPGSNFIGDQLRVRVERIFGGNQDSVKFNNLKGKDYVFNRGQEIQIEKEVAGEDKRIKPTGWLVQDIFIPGSTSGVSGDQNVITPPASTFGSSSEIIQQPSPIVVGYPVTQDNQGQLQDGSVIKDSINNYYKKFEGQWHTVNEPDYVIDMDKSRVIDFNYIYVNRPVLVPPQLATTTSPATQPATRQASTQSAPQVETRPAGATTILNVGDKLGLQQIRDLPEGSIVVYKMTPTTSKFYKRIGGSWYFILYPNSEDPNREDSLDLNAIPEEIYLVRSGLEATPRPTPPKQGYGFLVLKQGVLLPGYGSPNLIPSFGGVIPNVGTGYSGSNYGQGDELLLVYDTNLGGSYSKQQLIDWYTKILAPDVLNDLKSCPSSTKLGSLGINDVAACRFVSQKILNNPNLGKNNDEIIRKVTELISTVIVDFDIGDLPGFVLEKGAGIKASLRVGGSVIPFAEGDPLPRTQTCFDNTNNKIDYSCKVRTIQDDKVVITHYEPNTLGGNCIAIDETLYLNANTLGQRFDTYTYPLGGSFNIPPTPGVNYQTGTNKCGGYIELMEISSGRSVEVTILAGPPRGYAEAVFNLHIPIEKRAINLSVDKLDEQINSTKKMIESLNKVIDKLEKFVSVWMKICLAISAWFTIEAFLVGLPKYNKDTSAGPQASYSTEFKYADKEGFYDSYTAQQQTVAKSATSQPATQPTSRPATITGKLGNKIDGVDDGGFYYYEMKEGKPVLDENTKLPKKNYLKEVGVLYDNKGNQYEYDYFKKQMVSVTGISGKDRNQVQVFTGGDGKKRLIITPDKLEDTQSCLKYYSASRAIDVNKFKQKYGDNGYYLVFEEGETLQLWHKSGENVDFNTLQLGQNELRDQLVTEYPKTGAGATESIVYRSAEQNLGVIREAQIRGQSRAMFCGKPYQINDRGRLDKTKAKCEDILGEGKCKLLFNACDPVVCPRSRCNLGGQYYATGPGGVIGSGLVGSLLLCLPNIKDGVIVPICLSGILASLKGIRSHLQSYVKCLEAARTGQVSVGVCDKIKSIFICEFIWKEGLMLLNAKAGLINLANSQAGGGGEYFTQGVGGSIQEANEVVSFIVNDYADDVLAAYKGKGLPEIGAEICKASIAQRIPFMDALLGDAATPPDPPQFTAHFEETPYAPTLGKSKYQVYFHIYAGTPQREQGLNWMVYLKSFGSSPILRVGAGSLPPGESADETIDVIGDKGYQQVCVVLNGVEQCGFGKIVSSDMFLNTLNDYITSQELGANIETVAQCKSDPTSVVSTVGNRGILPGGPSVRRGCFSSNPGIGIGQEKFWRKVGSCGSDKQGVSLGDCYEYADWQRYPNIENQVLDLSCDGNICEANQQCNGQRTFITSQGKMCCERGSCSDKAYVGEINSMSGLSRGLSDSDKAALDETIRKDWKDGSVGQVGSSVGRSFFVNNPNEDEARFYIATKICNGEVVPNYANNMVVRTSECLDTVKKIDQNSRYYAPTHYMLAIIYDNEGNLDRAKEEYEIVRRTNNKELLTKEQIAIVEKRINEIDDKLKNRSTEEKNRVDSLQRKSKANELNQKISILTNEYYGFNTVIPHLKAAQKQFGDILINQAEAAESNAQVYNSAIDSAVNSIRNIDIKSDVKYGELRNDLIQIKSFIDVSQNTDKDRQTKQAIEQFIIKLNLLKHSKIPEIQNTLKDISNKLGILTSERNNAISLLDNLINSGLENKLKEPLNDLDNKVSELKVSSSQQAQSPSIVTPLSHNRMGA